MILIMLAVLFFAEFLHAETPRQSRFSVTTLRIGIESFLHDRLEETDEFEIANDIQEQIFDQPFVVARCDAAPESLAGSTRIQLVFSRNDNILRRVYVPVRITLRRTVAVATHSLQRGSVLQPSDVEYKLMDVTYMKHAATENVVGQRLTASVNQGGVINQQELGSPSAIQRGDAVTIVIQSGAVTVRAMGSALDNATNGQSLRVRRDDLGTIYTAVAGDSKVVYLSAPPVPPSSTSK